MATALRLLQKNHENINNKCIDISEWESELRSTERTLENVREQVEYFKEFWSSYKNENMFDLKGSKIFVKGVEIEDIILSKYEERIADLEFVVRKYNDEITKTKLIQKGKDVIEHAIYEVETLLIGQTPKCNCVYNKNYEIEKK